MKNFSARHWGLIAVSALFLTACDNAEDRARTHFEKGTNLAASGEIDKAMLEFRNALKLDSEAVEPRLAYAKLLVIRQDFNGAAQNYQVVVERHPENIEARRSLGQLLLLGNELDTARIHIDAAFRLAPEQVDVRALKANLDFRDDKVDEAVQQANSILKDLPGHATASLIIASHALLTDDFKGALAAVDSAIDVSPNEMNLHVSRLDVLTQQGDELGIGDQLKVMRGLDPSNMQVSRSLVRWHVSRNEFADGLNILRDVSRAAPQNVEMAMDVVRFLKTYEGDEAARTELATLVTSRPAQRAQYVMAQVALDREDGLLTDAVSRLSDLVASGVEGDDLLEAQVQLAQIYRAQGKAEDSAALVQEILTNDSRNVEALMLRSAEQLANDEPEQAISTLRNALDVSPQNPNVLTLLAQAHLRNGSRGLARERLALAVQASNYGEDETLRYADFLVSEDKSDVAMNIIQTAIDTNPQSPRLLGGLAQLHLRQSQWNKVEEILERLEMMPDLDTAETVANEVRVALLSRQERLGESIDLLQTIWVESGESSTAMERLVRTYLEQDDAPGAVSFLETILNDEPKNYRANLLMGAINVYGDDLEAAEARYRQTIEFHPNRENAYEALARLLGNQGRIDEANEVILAGLETAQTPYRLMFIRAGQLELNGDYDGAIALYQTLYDANKAADIVANNLASLLSEYRDDEASLEQAFAVAKRLRQSVNPAFQDTYGWILFKRGDYEQALKPLQTAAQGIPNNALVQFHFGMLLKELGLAEDAKYQLNRAVELAGEREFPQMAALQDALAALEGQ